MDAEARPLRAASSTAPAGPHRTQRRLARLRGRRASDAAIRLGSKGLFGSLFSLGSKTEASTFTGEPQRSKPDRAAGGIPDAIADPAVWTRPGE